MITVITETLGTLQSVISTVITSKILSPGSPIAGDGIVFGGKGNGTFEKWVYFNVDSAAACHAIAAGDFDGDTNRM